MKDPTEARRLARANHAIGALLYPEEPEGRPTSRDQCRKGVRPCPWARCRYHLAVAVSPRGDLHLREDADELADTQRPTCALDIADGGDHTLGEVGDALGIVRERTRQIEITALAKARAAAEEMGFDLESLLPPPAKPVHSDLYGIVWERGEMTPPRMLAYQNARNAAKREAAKAKGAA